MKNLKKHIAEFILLSVALSGCGIGKILSKDSTRNTERRAVETTSHISKDETVFAERGILYSDSSRHLYKVMIFPRDSFSFSLHDGFRGQAQKIEISGVADRLVEGKFQQMDFEINKLESGTTVSEKSQKNTRSVSKEIQRRSYVIFIILAVAVLFISGGLWWKFRSGRHTWS